MSLRGDFIRYITKIMITARIEKIICVCMLCLLGISGYAQESTIDLEKILKRANTEFEKEQYHVAIHDYEKYVHQDTTNALVYYRMGICYLHALSFEESLGLIEKSNKMNGEELIDPYYHFWHARALHHNYYFNEAIAEYEDYAQTLGDKDSRKEDEQLYVAQAKIGEDVYSHPLNYLVVNEGEVINSEFDDHSPLVTKDGRTMFFTSKRKTEEFVDQDPDGEYYEKIFVSHKDSRGFWTTPYVLGAGVEHAQSHDACIQLFDNDKKMLIHRQTHNGDLYISNLGADGKWGEPKPIDGINSNNFEVDASISEDGNTIIFSSSYKTENDDLDLFTSKKVNGVWEQPVSLGATINSEYDENSPFLTHDGKTLFFCSNGKMSMGGYDVFRSVLNDDGTWSEPENLGFPINSIDDDIYYHLNSKEEIAYFSSYREGGYGELDIYAIYPIQHVRFISSLIDDSTGKPINEDSIHVSFLSTPSSYRPYEDGAYQDSGLFHNDLLSNNEYIVVVSKNEDTLLVQNLSVPFSASENNEIVKEFRVKGYHPKDKLVSIDSTPIFDSTTIVSSESVHEGDRYLLKNILFDYNKAELRDESKQELDLLYNVLMKAEELEVEISGHTDNIGSESYNLRLSKKRAKSAVQYLKSKGIDSRRLVSKGYGESLPVASNKTEDGRQKNRRTEFKIVSK